MHVTIVLYDGFDDLVALRSFEVFKHAKNCGGTREDRPLHARPAGDYGVGHGLCIEPDGTVPPDPELVVVPGGGRGCRADVGAWGEAERGELADALAWLHPDGATVAPVWTGGMLVARAGLTDGRPAITHHDAVDDLRAAGAEVVDARVVDDGDLVTAGGVTACIDRGTICCPLSSLEGIILVGRNGLFPWKTAGRCEPRSDRCRTRRELEVKVPYRRFLHIEADVSGPVLKPGIHLGSLLRRDVRGAP